MKTKSKPERIEIINPEKLTKQQLRTQTRSIAIGGHVCTIEELSLDQLRVALFNEIKLVEELDKGIKNAHFNLECILPNLI